MKRKALAFILRQQDHHLLAYSFPIMPQLPWRLPGGTIETGEHPLVALEREVREETGLCDMRLGRFLGMQRYYKAYLQQAVERQDYLLYAPATTPDLWEHLGTGMGEDVGEVFTYHWLTTAALVKLDIEHRAFVTPDYMPEFFI